MISKRFIVTGGCGFIGSHLVQFLLAEGHSVTVIDDLSSGSKNNLDGFADSVDLIVSKVEDFSFDCIDIPHGLFHLAAQASVPYSVDKFFESSTTNVVSTLNVVDYCSRTKVPLIYASSSAVYGNLPLGDEHSSIDLLTPYAADKYVSEIYCEMANKLYGLRSYGLRFFNVYGPRQDPSSPYSGVISIFIDRLLRSLPLTINGGYQTRDFIYVSDIVDAIWQAYRYLDSNPIAGYSNVLTGNSITIDALASLLAEILAINPTLNYRELPFGDPVASSGTTEIMMSQLKLRPSISLRDGLSRTLHWMSSKYE